MTFAVLLSVHAGECPGHLSAAMQSIWDEQTLKPDQIVLVEDGPLPSSLRTEVRYWQDKLGGILTNVELPENVGLGRALNAGLKVCDHELIARMDSDDVALPERFRVQVAFMLAHPSIAAASAVVEECNEDLTEVVDRRVLPTNPKYLAIFARKRNPLSHPLVIFRRSAVMAVGGYPPLRKVQDYGLWSVLIVNGYTLANLPIVLLQMRTGGSFLGRRGVSYLKHEIKLLRFQRQIGFLRRREFLSNCLIRTGIRLSPDFIKRMTYRYLR